VQRAYSELAREGLLVSRAGRGTQVAGGVLAELSQARGTLRRANLVNRSEAFLLEALTSGFDLAEIQQAIDMAMDRWRVLSQPQPPKDKDSSGLLRFAGSHDMVVNTLARSFFSRVTPEITFEVSFNGSLGGLIALAEGRADLAGCHLWDA
jgi:DNA-binding transcriptional MocR family regulator